MKLTECQLGQASRVKSLSGHSSLIKRLLEMGLCEGKMIRLTHVAPFGDPVCIEFNGMSLAIRHAEAELVEVELP